MHSYRWAPRPTYVAAFIGAGICGIGLLIYAVVIGSIVAVAAFGLIAVATVAHGLSGAILRPRLALDGDVATYRSWRGRTEFRASDVESVHVSRRRRRRARVAPDLDIEFTNGSFYILRSEELGTHPDDVVAAFAEAGFATPGPH